eukprot:SAG31_NODE_46278_length_255_cov_0.660256_1_plen_66_part_10
MMGTSGYRLAGSGRARAHTGATYAYPIHGGARRGSVIVNKRAGSGTGAARDHRSMYRAPPVDVRSL